MEDKEHKSKLLRRQDHYMLGIAFVLGILSTLKAFDAGRLTPQAVILLVCAAIAAAWVLFGVFRRGGFQREPRRVILCLLFGIHLIATLFFFSPEDIFNDRPVLTLDHAVHYYQSVRAREVFWDTFRLYTYDPYFMAGFPGGTVFDIDMKGAELWCSLLPFISVARALKLFILLAFLLMVFTIYSGSRRLGFSYEESVFATLLFLVYWHWGRPYASHFRFAGMFAFIFVSHVSFYIAGLFRTFLDEAPSKRFFVLGPLAFFIHPTAAVLLPVPFLSLFLLKRRRVPPGRSHAVWTKIILLRLVVWCLLVIAVNAVWLVPLFRYLDIKTPSQAFFQLGGMEGLVSVFIKPGNIPALVLLVLAAVGLAGLFKERRFTEAVVTASTAAFLLFLAGFGIYLPGFDQMEPGRFLFSAMVFLAPLAGAGFGKTLYMSERFLRRPRLFAPMRISALVFLFLCSPFFALVASRSFYRHAVSTTPTPEVESLVGALKRFTDRSGRLMVEDGPAWFYGNSHLPSILPLYTGVEQIGGPYPFMFIEHHFSTFQQDKTMGKPLEKIEPGAFLDYLTLYNVHWVVTATAQMEAYIRELEPVESAWSSRHFTLWKVFSPGGFAVEPGVKVEAEYDNIHVKIATETGRPPPKNVLIKYHWDRGLKAAPPARLSPAFRLDDPVPFILVEPNGESDIRITFR